MVDTSNQRPVVNEFDEKVTEFISIRCPNKPKQDSPEECRSFCGGPSRSNIELHDYSEPYKHIQQCGNCRAFFEVVIDSRTSIPKLRVLPREEHIESIESAQYFGIESIEGRR